MKPTRFPQVSGKDLARIRDIYLTFTRDYPPYPGGEAEKWLYVIQRFQAERGDQVVPAELIQSEVSYLSNDMSAEYLAALDETVQFDFEEVNDDKRTLELLLATTEERLAAVAKLRGGGR